MSEATKGQTSRQKIMSKLLNELNEYCPEYYNKLVSKLSIALNLCPDTVKYSYVNPLIDVGTLIYTPEGVCDLAENIRTKPKGKPFTEYGEPKGKPKGEPKEG